MNPQTATNELWKTKPEVIRRFLESRPLCEKLSEEVAFILEAAVRKGGIEFAAVTFRAKTRTRRTDRNSSLRLGPEEEGETLHLQHSRPT